MDWRPAVWIFNDLKIIKCTSVLVFNHCTGFICIYQFVFWGFPHSKLFPFTQNSWRTKSNFIVGICWFLLWGQRPSGSQNWKLMSQWKASLSESCRRRSPDTEFGLRACVCDATAEIERLATADVRSKTKAGQP